jgi:hypothetical protein
MELYLHSTNTPSWHDAELKHRDNFTVTLPFYMEHLTKYNDKLYIYIYIYIYIQCNIRSVFGLQQWICKVR